MFQHTHIHEFTGQYSFMAICPLFGLIASVAVFLVRRTVRRAMDVSRGTSLIPDLTAAVLLVGLLLATVRPFVVQTYGLVSQTAESAQLVQVKYAQALQEICHDHPQITLANLKNASQNWGFRWLPHLITETNRTPKCGSKGA